MPNKAFQIPPRAFGMQLKKEIIDLYRKTAILLPDDVALALQRACEEEGPTGKEIMAVILQNIDIAKKEQRPICQDTGTPVFYIKKGKDYSEKQLREIIEGATAAATEEIPLRPNAVDSLSGKNLGNRPVLHFEESEKLEIDLMLKGGGSENLSAAYQLSNAELNAERNLDGVRKCILDAVFKAQGKGCPPYIIGAAIAGDLEEAAHLSKKQLLRKIPDANQDGQLSDFENRVLCEINQLGIGPLGLGGKTTALAVKISAVPRHPASFFVGISIGCWCMRRQSL